MNRKLFFIITIAILIRIFLASATFHTDTVAYQLAGQIVASGHILDFYDYLWTLPPTNIIAQNFPTKIFNYPPGIYLFYGAVNFLFANILHISLINDYLIIDTHVFGNLLFNIHQLILKSPYFFFDFLTALIFSKLFKEKKDQLLAIIFWLFNPVNLYATYMMGQHDIIPTFFVILSLFLINKNKPKIAAFSLGFGMIFKQFPLFLLIPLILTEKKIINKIKLFVIGVLPYILLQIIYLPSKGFRINSLVADQTLKSFYAQIPISGGEALILFPVVLIFLYLVFYYQKINYEKLWVSYFLVLLIFFIFTHSHPQWFLWLTPFIIIDLIISKFKHWLPALLSLVSFIGLLFFFDPSLTVGMFAPIWPGLYNMPGIWQILKMNPDYNMCRSILQSLFAGVAVFYIYFHFFSHPRKIEDE